MSFFNLASAESFISIICLFFAYCLSVTISGAGQSYIAYKMGDRTAYDEGFFSLNPLVHVDLLGALMLVLFKFGWGRQIPINPFYVKQKLHSLRLLLVYGSEALISMLLAVGALLFLVFFFKIDALFLAVEMFFSGLTPTRSFVQTFPHTPSVIIVGALFLLSIVFFNVFIATYSIFLNGMKYIMARAVHYGYHYAEYTELFVIAGPLVFLFLFAQPLSNLLIHIILYSAYWLSMIFGLL